jgi:KaiC/GvpD/RAD55 family RecA-like ATPase
MPTNGLWAFYAEVVIQNGTRLLIKKDMNKNLLIDAALFYASRGWLLFPCKTRDKTPTLKWRDEATKDSDRIREWWTKTPEANIGIMCGKESGIVVLDVDRGHGGDESLMALIVEHGQLPTTPESITGGGGRHIFFLHPGIEIPNSAGKLGLGLDIRGDGGYVVAPPSVHPSGKIYEWEASGKPSQIPLAFMPQWLIDLLIEKTMAIGGNGHKPASEIPIKIERGARNQTLASLAGSMRRRGMDAESIYAALQVENNKRCDPPLPDGEVRQIAESYDRYQPKTPPQFVPEKTEYHEPSTAYELASKFVDLLDNLEGRSIPTWIIPLDKSVGGLERQTLTVLAGRPGMGKSTLAWQIARNIATNKQKIFFYSLEMSATSLWAKASCGALGIRWRDVRNGGITDLQRESIIRKSNELMDVYGDKLLVDDGINTTDTIRIGAEKHSPDLIVIDHLRLVADKGEDEIQRLGAITQWLKFIAKDYNCAVLCLAQLNRGVENRENKRPQLSDLRDSGQIEENSDVVLMMYREDYYEPTATPPPYSVTELLVRKFRDDVLQQQIKLYFDLKNQWFGDEEYVKNARSAGMQRRLDIATPVVYDL